MDILKMFGPRNNNHDERRVYYKSFKKLTKKQINEIVEIVDKEAEKIKEYGLDIRPGGLQKEKIAVLVFICHLGGLDIAKILFADNWDRHFKSFASHLRKSLPFEFYFKNNPRRKTRTLYNVHQESVVAAIMHYIIK